ncbi:MAG TPA: amino acid permease [Steroidobacteraceae bacterium]|nr:amino acid permease [Steroidobacteraceae bacterium]
MNQPHIPDQAAPANQLSRSLQGRHLTMISIGGIIGAGLFVGSSTAIIAAGPAVFISYAITGLLILLVMRMLGEMATALPNVRSFTEFARAGLGDGAGFVIGWLYWYFWVLVVPVEAIAGAKILQTWIPFLSPLQIGLGLMTIMTAVNLMSARSYAEFEFWFASIKVAAILVFVAIAASYAFGWTAPHGATFGNLSAYGGFAPHSWIAVLAAVPTVYFAMTGAEITTIAAAESAQPGRAVAKMTTTVIWRILIFYVVSIFLIVSVIPWSTVRSGESPFTLALNAMHVPWADKIMSAIILTAVLSCLNSAFYVSSRVLFILAGRGDAPQSLIKLNARRVPVASVLIGAASGFLGIIAATEAPQAVFDFLVSSSGALSVFIYMSIAFAQIALRRGRERSGEANPAILMWLFPYLSYAAIAGMAAVLIAMAFTPGQQRDFYFSCITLAVAVLACLIVRRRLKPRTAPARVV